VRHLGGFYSPSVGWIKTIREVLGMSARQLGQKTNVTPERIFKIESDELKSKLTMATLEKMAVALNCKFVYGFVPNSSLTQIIENAAEEKAKSQLQIVSHTMSLEDQKVSNEASQEQAQLLKGDLLQGNIRRIWDK
jgi:predicted DNA-binding mobile mystery protein A